MSRGYSIVEIAKVDGIGILTYMLKPKCIVEFKKKGARTKNGGPCCYITI
jgi:hypothetical protein